MELIVTVAELECVTSDNATWDVQPYKHNNADVRYKPCCPVCHSRMVLVHAVAWYMHGTACISMRKTRFGKFYSGCGVKT